MRPSQDQAGRNNSPISQQLPVENINGHLKKLLLLREAIEQTRSRLSLEGLTILDVGCGSGAAVTQHLGGDHDDVLGVDMYEPNVEYANRKFRRPGLKFELRSAESLAAERIRFDVIILADVLEHLDDPALVLAECRRLANPGGRFLMSIPNGYGPFELESALSRLPWIGIGLLRLTDYFIAALNKFGPFKGVWTKAALNAPIDIPYNNESGHVQFFSFRRIEALLRTANFRVVKAVNLSLFSGPFSNYLCGSWPRFCRWNSRIADKAPRIAASAWFFECEPSSRDKPGLGETEQSGRRLDDQVSPVGDAQRASVAAIVTRNGLARLSGA